MAKIPGKLKEKRKYKKKKKKIAKIIRRKEKNDVNQITFTYFFFNMGVSREEKKVKTHRKKGCVKSVRMVMTSKDEAI